MVRCGAGFEYVTRHTHLRWHRHHVAFCQQHALVIQQLWLCIILSNRQPICSLRHFVKLLAIFSGTLRTSYLCLCFANRRQRCIQGDLETIPAQRPHLDLNRTNSADKAVRQQQRQQFGLIAVFSTEPGLQLRAAEQELLAAWEVVRGACSILLLSASPLDSLIIAVQVEESLDKGQRSVKRKVAKRGRRMSGQTIRCSCRVASEKAVQIEAKKGTIELLRFF